MALECCLPDRGALSSIIIRSQVTPASLNLAQHRCPHKGTHFLSFLCVSFFLFFLFLKERMDNLSMHADGDLSGVTFFFMFNEQYVHLPNICGHNQVSREGHTDKTDH